MRLRARDHWLHFKHSHWWKRRRWSKSARGTNEVCECKLDVKSTWTPPYKASNGPWFHGHLEYPQKPPLGGRPNTKPGDHGTPNTHNRWFIWFYHARRHAWIKIHRSSIWLRTQSHMTSHHTQGPVTTLHDLGSVLGRPLDTFVWALTISWSRLSAREWSGPKLS